MSLLDIPAPSMTGTARLAQPLGQWPAPPSAAKSEAQRKRAIEARARQREQKQREAD